MKPNGDEVAGTAIQFTAVDKHFEKQEGTITAVQNVSLDVADGELAVVIGPSGCGKSTLLRMLVGLMAPTRGEVFVQSERVTTVNTDVGFVTQDSNLFPWMTLRENVEFPLIVRGVSPEERAERSRHFIDLVGLQGFDDHYPYELSGGMQKRASIIRTLAYNPSVVLMDEPFGSVDAQTKLVLQQELLRLWKDQGNTILFVTHDLSEAVTLADRVIVMSRRPGTVKAVLDINLARPRDPFEIQTHPDFPDQYSKLWETFKDEIVRDEKMTEAAHVDD